MSRRRSITRNLVWAGTALGSLALALAAGGAEAQAIGSPPAGGQATAAPADQPAHEDGLSEIVVTASRREESAKDVPVAVSVIAGEKLDVLNSSGLDVRFLAARVPSLQVESSFGRTFPASTSAGSATPISIPTPRSRCRSSMTTWRWKARC